MEPAGDVDNVVWRFARGQELASLGLWCVFLVGLHCTVTAIFLRVPEVPDTLQHSTKRAVQAQA